MASLEGLRDLKYTLAEYNNGSNQSPFLVFKNPACNQDPEDAGIVLAADFEGYLIDRLEGIETHCDWLKPELMHGNLLWKITGNKPGYRDVAFPIGIVIARAASRDIEVVIPDTAVPIFPDHIYPDQKGEQKTAALLDEYSQAFRALNWVSGRRNGLLPANLDYKFRGV